MRLFDITEAGHFCRPLTAYVPGTGQSLPSLHDKLKATRLVEGTPYFEVHRVSLLNAVERWILFAIADYRRALDMMIPSCAPWAHVTLYYSSFFAANAILGMFGVWVHFERLVDVENGVAANQVLRITKRARPPSGQRGNHQVFWDYFYEGCNAISPWVPIELQPVTVPVNNDRIWQIRARNEVNYDMSSAFDVAVRLSQGFNPKRLRSLHGPLAQQLEVTEGMLKLAIHCATLFDIRSFAYEGLASGTRARVLRALVMKTPPSVVTQSTLQHLLQ